MVVGCEKGVSSHLGLRRGSVASSATDSEVGNTSGKALDAIDIVIHGIDSPKKP